MPDHTGADLEVQRSRSNLAAGDLAHAAVHLARALDHDPSLQAAYTCLNDLAEAAGSFDAARAMFAGDGGSVAPGNAAAITALLPGQGQIPQAVELLGSLTAANPAKPWAAAPWFSPDLAATLPEISIGRAITTVWQAIGNPAPEPTARAAQPWLALARAAAARPDIRADVLCAASALARRLGAHDDAIAWCQAAVERDNQTEGVPSQHTLIMLGYAYRDAGRPAEAIEAWTRATTRTPANADLLLDLADITFDQGDFPQSLRWAERAAALKGSAPKPKVQAALLAARFRTSTGTGTGGSGSGSGDPVNHIPDAAPLIQLADLSAANPESAYIRRCLSRACDGMPWLMLVPPPTEAICASYGELARIEESGEGQVTSAQSYMTSLEAPTPMTLHRTRFPQASIQLGPIIEPDPRTPMTTQFGTPLWSYDGTHATATVPPPGAEALELVHDVGGGIWADPLVAYDQAAGFATLNADDLLGLLAHMPPPTNPSWVKVNREHPLTWQRLAQVWVCVGILHHRPEQPWADSGRRALLLRLLFGPEDWTVEAAAFALCVSAWRFPAQRADVAEVIGRRYLHAAEALGRRPTQLHDPLARILLICPAADRKIARQARKALDVQRQAADVVDTDQLKESLLRRWTRRKDR
ncbi:tetratricopeptide (TPR) repeat protein [Catenulispora sp. GP43]|uniref:tetratricopeptide repeat protein n=1 Tax=Catenulispora sp. GP43 TaxID=3156263 RepID=UPI003515CA91